MPNTFQFEIITLSGKPYTGKVASLVVPGEKGYFGVLANHAALISNCVFGKLKIREESGNEIFFQTGKGFFEVIKNQAVLLAAAAEKIPASSSPGS